MLIYDNFSKNFHVIFKNFLMLIRKFLSYLICVPSFKLINSSSLSRKKYDGNNFTPTPCTWLRGQNTLVGIGLIKLSEPCDTLNYKPFFKHCILKTILHIFSLFVFLWNKIFCFKNWAVFYIFFDLVWVGLHLVLPY